MPDPKRLLPITYFNLAGKNLNPKRCIYKRNQSTLTTAGNPKITTHPSIVGRTGEEWEGKFTVGHGPFQNRFYLSFFLLIIFVYLKFQE